MEFMNLFAPNKRLGLFRNRPNFPYCPMGDAGTFRE